MALKVRSSEIPVNQMNMITAGTSMEGTLETNGSLQINGKVKGTIRAVDEVRVGRSGEIIGEIYAKNARIAGKVEGNVFIEQKLTLEETSSLVGNLTAGKLIIDEGAFFNGKSAMGDGAGKGLNGKKGLFQMPEVTEQVASQVDKK